MKSLQNKFRVLIGCSIVLYLGFMPTSGLPQEVSLLPSLTLGGEYNNNVLFTNVDEKDDYIFNIRPELTLEYNTNYSILILPVPLMLSVT